MMWLYEIYEASRCLCHTERLGLDHWISREGGLLLPRWSTLRTSWMTRSCRPPTTGAQNGICIMTTTITNVTTVSTISLLIMPYSVGLVPAHVTQIVRSPAENGSPWLSQVFHRWGCCVAFHQALLSLHSALGLKNIWKTWAHFLSNGLLAAFFGVWGVWECSGSSIWDNMVTLLLCKGRKRVLKWTAQRCATMTPFTALNPFVDLGHLVWNCQERCWTQLFCLWVEELKGFAGFAQSFLLGHGRTRDSNNLFKSLLNLITNILWFNMLQISPIVTAPSQNNPLANWPNVLLSGIGWVGFLNRWILYISTPLPPYLWPWRLVGATMVCCSPCFLVATGVGWTIFLLSVPRFQTFSQTRLRLHICRRSRKASPGELPGIFIRNESNSKEALFHFRSPRLHLLNVVQRPISWTE